MFIFVFRRLKKIITCILWKNENINGVKNVVHGKAEPLPPNEVFMKNIQYLICLYLCCFEEKEKVKIYLYLYYCIPMCMEQLDLCNEMKFSCGISNIWYICIKWCIVGLSMLQLPIGILFFYIHIEHQRHILWPSPEYDMSMNTVPLKMRHVKRRVVIHIDCSMKILGKY